jgi:hypothetical protein
MRSGFFLHCWIIGRAEADMAESTTQHLTALALIEIDAVAECVTLDKALFGERRGATHVASTGNLVDSSPTQVQPGYCWRA